MQQPSGKSKHLDEEKLGISETHHLHSPLGVWGGFFFSPLNIHTVKTHAPQALQLRLSTSQDVSVFDAQTIKSANYLHR